MQRLSDRLGLNPVARRQLEQKGDGAGEQLAKVFAELSQREEKAKAQDADFEPASGEADEGGGPEE